MCSFFLFFFKGDWWWVGDFCFLGRWGVLRGFFLGEWGVGRGFFFFFRGMEGG